MTGGAPIAKEVYDFIKICFSWNTLEGYGLTETNSGIVMTKISDRESGHVGGPYNNILF